MNSENCLMQSLLPHVSSELPITIQTPDGFRKKFQQDECTSLPEVREKVRIVQEAFLTAGASQYLLVITFTHITSYSSLHLLQGYHACLLKIPTKGFETEACMTNLTATRPSGPRCVASI